MSYSVEISNEGIVVEYGSATDSLAALGDPGEDKLVGWDDSAGTWAYFDIGTGGGGSGTVTSITLTQPAAGLTITGSGTAITTSGTRTFALANDLAALEALSGTNTIYYRSADSVWSAVTIGSSLSFSGGTLNLGTTPALGTPASGDFSTGTFTWPTLNQNTTGTAAIATTVTAANEATDTTCFPLFVTAATGNLGPKTNASLTFNSSTGSIGITAPVVTGTISSPGSGSGASWSITTDGLLTLTGVDDTITLSNGVATVAAVVVSDGGSAVPATNDKAALGTASLSWSDLFLASGAVINFANGNAAITHSSGVINISTGALQVGGAAVLVSGGDLGTPSSGTVTNLTGTASININGTVGATTPAAGTFTTLVAGSTTSLLLGTTGSAVGNIGFRNATSGTITLAPTTGALGTVTQTLQAVSGTIYCTGGTDVSVADGGTGLSSGTSGGIPYFSSTTSIASSGALTANALMIGGGAGSAPSTTTTGTGNLTALAANANATGGFATTDGTATLTNKIISLAALPGTDDTYQGTVITGRNAGATIAQWEAVYLNSSGEWVLADANGSSTYPAQGLAVAAYSSGNAATVLVHGVARNDAWTWTVGGLVYLSATAGALTQTQPATTGDKVQCIGFALTADSIFVNPSSTFLEVA